MAALSWGPMIKMIKFPGLTKVKVESLSHLLNCYLTLLGAKSTDSLIACSRSFIPPPDHIRVWVSVYGQVAWYGGSGNFVSRPQCPHRKE